MRLLEEMKVCHLFCDGRMGSMLQARGLRAREMPEMWNLIYPEIVGDIHRQYLKAEASIMETNTFGANGLEYKDNPKEIITVAMGHAKTAVEEAGHGYVALDVRPTGKLLKPPGDLGFEDAVDLCKKMAAYDVKAEADLMSIATMSDDCELKTVVLAVKEAGVDLVTGENTPVSTSVTFDERGKFLTRGNVESTVALLGDLRADALGTNCGLGSEQMKGIPKDIPEVTSLSAMVNPNAGLLGSKNGRMIYDINEDQFTQAMREITDMGAAVAGGCCDTAPNHIRGTVKLCKDIPVRWPEEKRRTVIPPYARVVVADRETVIIGEWTNPMGEPKFERAPRNHNLECILREEVSQQGNGTDVLDVNVGLPEVDEPSMMEEVVKELQSIIDLLLQINTSNIEAMGRAMRAYNGKPLTDFVNGKVEVMSQAFPLVAKYGGVMVRLCLDEGGILETVEGRIAVGREIIDTVADHGIGPEDIILDGLCMIVSSDGRGALITLETPQHIRDKLGDKPVLGVSSISFDLSQREIINGASFTMAMEAGLNTAIINPNSEAIMRAFYSSDALMDRDSQCSRYISIYSSQAPGLRQAVGKNGAGQVAGNGGQASGASSALSDGEDIGALLTLAIEREPRDMAHQAVGVLLEKRGAPDIINDHMIPAPNRVGKGFRKGTVFLPQLLMSAGAAKAAFEATKTRMDQSSQVQEKGGTVILATVKGDIYDIGKNIVKVLLKNYGCDIMDLGKDIPPGRIVEEAVKGKVPLVRLNALMTTAAPSIEEIIQKLGVTVLDAKVMVGGAVLTEEYARAIGADMYCRDVMASVNYAENIFVR